jgi:hypothetical protein
LSRQVAIFRSTPLPDFTEEERAEVTQAIRAAIDGDRYVLSPRVKRLKSDETLRKVFPPKNG